MLNHGSEKMNILHHSSDGYVALCPVCNRYQLGFGTTVVKLDESPLRELISELDYITRTFVGQVDPRTKAFMLPLPCDDVAMVVNHEEAGRLHAMLSDALWLHGILGQVAEGCDPTP